MVPTPCQVPEKEPVPRKHVDRRPFWSQPENKSIERISQLSIIEYAN